jgi:hypothetical protein
MSVEWQSRFRPFTATRDEVQTLLVKAKHAVAGHLATRGS